MYHQYYLNDFSFWCENESKERVGNIQASTELKVGNMAREYGGVDRNGWERDFHHGVTLVLISKYSVMNVI